MSKNDQDKDLDAPRHTKNGPNPDSPKHLEDLQAVESQRAGKDQTWGQQHLEFTRLPDGGVALHMNGEELCELSEAAWVASVASVSSGGNTDDRTPAMLDFHRSLGRVQLTRKE